MTSVKFSNYSSHLNFQKHFLALCSFMLSSVFFLLYDASWRAFFSNKLSQNNSRLTPLKMAARAKAASMRDHVICDSCTSAAHMARPMCSGVSCVTALRTDLWRGLIEHSNPC